MQFNINIIERLSSGAKVKALKFVLNPGFRMTGRELGRLCGISHTMADMILKDFMAINLVTNFRAGKSVIWQPKTDSYAYLIGNKLYGKKEDYIPFEHLRKMIILKLPETITKRAVLFGSVSKGTEKLSSDIDLFVLVEGMKDKIKMEKLLEDLSYECVKLYGNTLGFYILTESELAKRKNLAVIKNIEKGIIII